MQKEGSKLKTIIFEVSKNKTDNINVICFDEKIEDAIKIYSDLFKAELAKRVRDSIIKISDKVRIITTYEYSNYNEEDSEFVTITQRTVSPLREITIYEKTIRNPKFVDNPMCKLCYKQVTQLYDDHLLNADKTPTRVCKRCVNELKKMRSIYATLK